jgi:hypothetical protein
VSARPRTDLRICISIVPNYGTMAGTDQWPLIP